MIRRLTGVSTRSILESRRHRPPPKEADAEKRVKKIFSRVRELTDDERASSVFNLFVKLIISENQILYGDPFVRLKFRTVFKYNKFPQTILSSNAIKMLLDLR